MRFAAKVVPLGILGYAAALLVACGGSEGLLPSEDASGLQDALVVVQSACAAGEPARAEAAAQEFSDRVAELSAREVDPRLIANLEQGAATLQSLAGTTCTAEIPTTPTTTTPTTTPTTTVPTTPTTTVPTTPTETTPTTPTTPVETTPTTPTTPSNTGGGGAPGGAGSGGAGATP